MPNLAPISAVILAAGRSGRMGVSKPLLALRGKTVLEVVLDTFREAGVADIVAVVGHARDRLVPLLGRTATRWVENPNPGRGMFSSVKIGCAAVQNGSEAVFIHPADVPLIRPATLQGLAACLRSSGKQMVVPTHAGQRGHPPLLAAALIPELLAYGGKRGLRGFLAAHESDLEVMPCDDPGVVLDMDTPQDYERLRARA
jgi:probable phosphoglycerate mutase